MARTSSDLVIECIEDIRAGRRTIEECSAAHPELSRELADLAPLALVVQSPANWELDPAAKQRTWDQLLAAIAHNGHGHTDKALLGELGVSAKAKLPAIVAWPVEAWGRLGNIAPGGIAAHPWLATISGAVGAMVAGGAVVYAAQSAPPDSVLYPVHEAVQVVAHSVGLPVAIPTASPSPVPSPTASNTSAASESASFVVQPATVIRPAPSGSATSELEKASELRKSAESTPPNQGPRDVDHEAGRDARTQGAAAGEGRQNGDGGRQTGQIDGRGKQSNSTGANPTLTPASGNSSGRDGGGHDGQALASPASFSGSSGGHDGQGSASPSSSPSPSSGGGSRSSSPSPSASSGSGDGGHSASPAAGSSTSSSGGSSGGPSASSGSGGSGSKDGGGSGGSGDSGRH